MTCYNSELPIGPAGPTGPQGPQGEQGPVGPGVLLYKVYSALITQTGSAAPIATIMENTLGFTPTWVRDAAGFYSSNNTEWVTPITDRKIMAFISPVVYQQLYNFFRIASSSGDLKIILVTGNYVQSTNIFTGIDTLLRDDDDYQHTSIEIRIYP